MTDATDETDWESIEQARAGVHNGMASVHHRLNPLCTAYFFSSFSPPRSPPDAEKGASPWRRKQPTGRSSSGRRRTTSRPRPACCRISQRTARVSFGSSRSAPATARPPCAAAGWSCIIARAIWRSCRRSTPPPGSPAGIYDYPSHFVDPFGYNNGPRCSPLLTKDRCYTFGAEGVLLCLDLATASRSGSATRAPDFNVPEAFFGVGSSPILEGDLLIVMVGGQPNAGVVAFDAATGKTVWENVGEKTWNGVAMTGWPGERVVQLERRRPRVQQAGQLLHPGARDDPRAAPHPLLHAAGARLARSRPPARRGSPIGSARARIRRSTP